MLRQMACDQDKCSAVLDLREIAQLVKVTSPRRKPGLKAEKDAHVFVCQACESLMNAASRRAEIRQGDTTAERTLAAVSSGVSA